MTIVESLSTETPSLLTVKDQEHLQWLPGVNLDDRLRSVPGFSLFRRSSSLVAHPTAQGVSLRGIGPTGASRTLVRWDGVPVNDPFGGWVQWARFDPEELGQVEVVRSASTSAFGDRSMGGVISLFTEQPSSSRLRAGFETGNQASRTVSAGGTWLGRRMALASGVRAFTTRGYFVVPEEIRGSVDRRADLRFVAGNARLDLTGTNQRLFLKFDALAEERGNGTALQSNSTTLGSLAGHYSRQDGQSGLSLTGYHTRQEFRSSFSAIAANRQSEQLTTLQSVPAQAGGAAGLWQLERGSRRLLAGADLHHVEGFSHDTAAATGVRRSSGGSQTQHGYFLQTGVPAGPARLLLGARYHFAGAGRRFFSPSAGLTSAVGRFRLRGSAYRAFRAPTLNELYREFRAGNAITRANDRLGPESLTGAEAGFDLAGEAARASLTLYYSRLDDLITNVTLSTTPNLIVRQRQNRYRGVARGVEAGLARRWRRWTAEAAYLFADSRFSGGVRIPQVPRHQGSAQVTFASEATVAAFGLRAFSLQFEDDANLFILPGFASLHLAVRRRLTAGLFAVAAAENLLDRRYLTGFTPQPQIGPPRLWRLGLRWETGR